MSGYNGWVENDGLRSKSILLDPDVWIVNGLWCIREAENIKNKKSLWKLIKFQIEWLIKLKQVHCIEGIVFLFIKVQIESKNYRSKEMHLNSIIYECNKCHCIQYPTSKHFVVILDFFLFVYVIWAIFGYSFEWSIKITTKKKWFYSLLFGLITKKNKTIIFFGILSTESRV